MYDKHYYSGDINAAINAALANSKTEYVWLLHKDVNYDNFDLRFLPDRFQQQQAHAWSSHYNNKSFTTWLLPKNYTDVNYHDELLPIKNSVKKIHWPDFTLEQMHGDSWYDSLCKWLLDNDQVTDEWVWIIDKRIDYSGFNFDWLPDYFDQSYIHCFTNENKKQLSYTWLVNRSVLQNRQFKFIEYDFQFTNFDRLHADILLFDMGCHMQDFKLFDKNIKFIGTMDQMLKTAIKRTDSEYLWVISSCCDYTGFDFTWLPDADQVEHTHCWPSDDQLKGETFLIHIPSYRRTQQFNFNFNHEPVKRKPWPVVMYDEDNLAEAINEYRALTKSNSSIYAFYFKNGTVWKKLPSPCLWEDRPVISLNRCNSASFVPRDCVVKEEIYEYPYLEKHEDYAEPVELTLVFLHNKEKDQQFNYIRLTDTKPDDLRSVRVISGVTPRLAAYQTAAQASANDWFLAVFAKCFMNSDFKNFDWRPDYWQKPKHYIFYNHNRDLDITYGHMAPIAYNKKLMLANKGGLDMTLVQEHAVVPIVLSMTKLTDPWDTWRTAFRETTKLLYYIKTDTSIEMQYRLSKWLEGNDNNIWYARGAMDAKNWFESIDGDYGWVMLTNEWDWLRRRFDSFYSAVLTT